MALTKRYNENGVPVYSWEDDEEAPSLARSAGTPFLPQAFGTGSQNTSARQVSAQALRSPAPSQSPSFVRQQSAQNWMARQAGLPRPSEGDAVSSGSAPLSKRDSGAQDNLDELYRRRSAAMYQTGPEAAKIVQETSRRIQELEDPSKVGAAARNVLYGFSALGPAVVSTVNALAQPAFRGVTPATDSLLDALQNYNDSLQRGRALETEEIQRINEESGLGNGLAAGVAQTFGGMVPNALLAAMSSGTSAAPQLAQQGGNALAQLGGQLVRNPSAWLSAAQTLGPSYEEALAQGVDPDRALAAAGMEALLSSAIEVQGGLEGIPQGTGLLRSMAEEGMEEVTQGMLHGAAQNAIAGLENPIFSLEDQRAVVNPLRAGEEFALGAAGAGLMGGIMRIPDAVSNLSQGSLPQGPDYVGDAPSYVRPENTPVPSVGKAEVETAAADGAAIFAADTPTSSSAGPVQVGRATTLYNPYTGETPSYAKPRDAAVPSIEKAAVDTAAAEISRAQARNASEGASLKSQVRKFYEALFDRQGGQRAVPVNGASFRGEPYLVTLNKNIVGKVVSDPNMTPEKLAVFNAIDQVVANGEYVGSASYIPKGNRKKLTTRFDYFETPITIDGKDYLVTFDTEVFPNANNYRTHRVINRMDLQPLTGADTGPEPAADVRTTGPSNTIIADSTAGVNSSMPSQGARNQALSAGSGTAAVTQAVDAKPRAPQEDGYLTAEEVSGISRRLQAARRARDTAVRRAGLGKEENRVVDQLLAGIRDLDQIPQGMDAQGIRAVYEARRTVAELDAVLKADGHARRNRYKAEADEITAGMMEWRDKLTGLQYSRETPERNFRDVIRDKATAEKAVDTYITQIHRNQAAKTRRMKEIAKLLEPVRKLGTKERYTLPVEGYPESRKWSERELVMLLGEGRVTETQAKAAGADTGRVMEAVRAVRSVLDSVHADANEARVRHGYDPIEYRQDYFPHFQDEEGGNTALGKLRYFFGVRPGNDKLPTDIAGITHLFRPGTRWVGNFLRRQGNDTSFNILQNLDRYLDGALDVIYHTADIQRLRALESSIRYQMSDDGVKERARAVEENPALTPDEAEEQLEKIYGAPNTHLSNFVTWLRQYTDNLAGKKAIGDREMEYQLSRKMYGIMNAVERRVAANMVGGNISSALTNFIPIFQSMGEVSPVYTARAIQETAKAARSDDGFADASDFLTNRFGSDPLYRTGLQKATDAASLPFSMVDRFTSEVVTRSKYLQNVAQGMGKVEALEDADAFAASIMADRSKGATPTAFNTQNPVAKAFSMFQVEVNNQLSYYFKDLPRNVGERGKAAVAGALFRTFLATWLYGTLFEKLAGYDPTFNPIGMGLDFYQDTQEEGVEQAAANLATEAAGQLPFVGNFAGGGRLPVADMFPDVARIAGSFGEENFQEVLGDELLSSAAQLLPPLGGNQLRKTIQGLETVREGGYYTTNKEGEEQLRFPVEQTPGNYLRGAIFGRWSFPEAQEYIDSGFKPLSAAYTAKMKQGEARGITPQQFLAAYDAQRNATWAKGEHLAKSKAQKAAIDAALPGLSSSQKEFLYGAFGVSDQVW